jgi:predicted nucleic acid-binding protein
MDSERRHPVLTNDNTIPYNELVTMVRNLTEEVTQLKKKTQMLEQLINEIEKFTNTNATIIEVQNTR